MKIEEAKVGPRDEDRSDGLGRQAANVYLPIFFIYKMLTGALFISFSECLHRKVEMPLHWNFEYEISNTDAYL